MFSCCVASIKLTADSLIAVIAQKEQTLKKVVQ